MPLDPLALLQREDKWFLANGRGAMYAPEFPRFADHIGYWDTCYWADLPLARLFTVTLLEGDRPLPLRLQDRTWRPDVLTQHYQAPGLEVLEQRVIVGEHAFCSRLTLTNTGDAPRRLDLVQWSMQDHWAAPGPDFRGGSSDDFACQEGVISYRYTYFREGASHPLYCALGADRPPASCQLSASEWCDDAPRWENSILPEHFRQGRLPGPLTGAHLPELIRQGHPRSARAQLALHYPLSLAPGASALITLGLGLGSEPGAGERALRTALADEVAAASEADWRRYFASVPHFECDDEYFTRYYWYRWYGLRLLMVSVCEGRLPYPCVFEGIGGFRQHISYSAQCHMLECSWMHFPAFAEGSLQNFTENQLESGSFAGHIGVAWHDQGFYHANWGRHALQIYALFRDKGFLKAIYQPLCRYAAYFQAARDPEGSHLYDAITHWETGQEYASRYQFVHEQADQWLPIRLKGVDVSVYLYELFASLAEIARLIGRPAQEAAQWQAAAQATGQAIQELMWDGERAEFCDLRPGTWERSPYSHAVSFYPFLTDLVGPEHLPALRRHLLDEQRFWSPWPVPTASLDDPCFNAEAYWKGVRMNCPWSGRVWPMTNSHLCAALAQAAQRLDPSLEEAAAELLRRFVRLMFFDQDPARPNCFEHYNPLTGAPCLYRGVDDYQHSWVVDLIIKCVAGLQPRLDQVVMVHPLPCGLQHFRLERVQYAGHWLDLRYQADRGLELHIDGKLAASRPDLGPLEATLPEK